MCEGGIRPSKVEGQGFTDVSSGTFTKAFLDIRDGVDNSINSFVRVSHKTRLNLDIYRGVCYGFQLVLLFTHEYDLLFGVVSQRVFRPVNIHEK